MSAEGTERLHEITDRLISEATRVNGKMMAAVFSCGTPWCRGHFGTSLNATRHLAGEVPEGSLGRLEALAEELGYRVLYDWWTTDENTIGQTITLHEGDTDGVEVRDIHVKPRMSDASTLRTLTHEIIHVLAGGVYLRVPDDLEQMSEVQKALTMRNLVHTHTTDEVRALLGACVVMEALGVVVSDSGNEMAQLAVVPELEAATIFQAIRAEVIVHTRRILAVIQPEEPAWQQ